MSVRESKRELWTGVTDRLRRERWSIKEMARFISDEMMSTKMDVCFISGQSSCKRLQKECYNMLAREIIFRFNGQDRIELDNGSRLYLIKENDSMRGVEGDVMILDWSVDNSTRILCDVLLPCAEMMNSECIVWGLQNVSKRRKT